MALQVYDLWLKWKQEFEKALSEDKRLQELATKKIGIKPQSTAVEIVARVYCKYCALYNKLCDLYDQMLQVQRRPFVKEVIDMLSCRILELKRTLETVEQFEFTYADNAMQQLIMIPTDVEILCPFFYPIEIREQEMQYIKDEIMSGNRLGDPTPTPSQIEREQEALAEQERIRQEEREAEINRKLAMGEDILETEDEPVLSPAEMEEKRKLEEYNLYVATIQRMERARTLTMNVVQKRNKDMIMYLDLAGLRKPAAPEELRDRAASFIKKVYKKFMELKREKIRETKLKLKLGMVIPSILPAAQESEVAKIQAIRRNYRQRYYKDWIKANIKEKTHVLLLKEGAIMEDISTEIREWFQEWYDQVRTFDEFPYPQEGGSILIVRGDTFTIEEYHTWRKEYEKKQGEEPKSKDVLKAERAAARAEKKQALIDAKLRAEKQLADYKKQRLNPKNDPGVYISEGVVLEALQKAWFDYETKWRDVDVEDAPTEAVQGFIMEMVTEDAYQEVQYQLRPIVDEMMKLELAMLKAALKVDYKQAGLDLPPTKKRKKPKKVKPPRKEKVTPAQMFQKLFDEGLVRECPKVTMADYLGDRNFAAADLRSIPWTPKFPPPCVGDVREQLRVRCLLTLGCCCPNAERSHLFVGPKASGKKTLVYAIATETNATFIDLSSQRFIGKFPGKELKKILSFVSKISKIMQPTVILVENADKVFYKRVPKEEKHLEPARLAKDLFKEIIKPIAKTDKILVIGTAAEPWLSKAKPMKKAFPTLTLIPRTDYGSISLVLNQMLMKYHGVNREFNVHSLAQTARGYDLDTIKKAVNTVLCADRIPKLHHIPLHPTELLNQILDTEGATCTETFDMEVFQNWYQSYSPWGQKYLDYQEMLEAHLEWKIKEDKKKKKK